MRQYMLDQKAGRYECEREGVKDAKDDTERRGAKADTGSAIWSPI